MRCFNLCKCGEYVVIYGKVQCNVGLIATSIPQASWRSRNMNIEMNDTHLQPDLMKQIRNFVQIWGCEYDEHGQYLVCGMNSET